MFCSYANTLYISTMLRTISPFIPFLGLYYYLKFGDVLDNEDNRNIHIFINGCFMFYVVIKIIG